jgi:hypothetical protein
MILPGINSSTSSSLLAGIGRETALPCFGSFARMARIGMALASANGHRL